MLCGGRRWLLTHSWLVCRASTHIGALTRICIWTDDACGKSAFKVLFFVFAKSGSALCNNSQCAKFQLIKKPWVYYLITSLSLLVDKASDVFFPLLNIQININTQHSLTLIDNQFNFFLVNETIDPGRCIRDVGKLGCLAERTDDRWRKTLAATTEWADCLNWIEPAFSEKDDSFVRINCTLLRKIHKVLSYCTAIECTLMWQPLCPIQTFPKGQM